MLKDSMSELPNAEAYALPYDVFERLVKARNPLIHDAKKSRRRLVEAAVKLARATTEAKAVLQKDTRDPSYIFADAANRFHDKADKYRLEMEKHVSLRRYKERFPAAMAAACPYCIAMGRDPEDLSRHIASFHGGLLNYEEDLHDVYLTSTDDDEV